MSVTFLSNTLIVVRWQRKFAVGYKKWRRTLPRRVDATSRVIALLICMNWPLSPVIDLQIVAADAVNVTKTNIIYK